jgi:hypothetical protein
VSRFELSSKQADGSANWVEVTDPDDLTAEILFAIHRAARVSTTDGSYSPRELEDDTVNAFLGHAIAGWSFPAPIPSQNNLVAADRAIGRVMKAKDWSSLKIQVKPLMDELEGVERDDPKLPLSS